MPKLQGSTCQSAKPQVVKFFGPFDICNRVSSCWNLNNSFFLIGVEDTHLVVVAWVDHGNVSAAWTECNRGHPLCVWSKTELVEALHGVCVPNVDRWLLTNFACYSKASSVNIASWKRSNIILVAIPIRRVFILLFFHFETSEVCLVIRE